MLSKDSKRSFHEGPVVARLILATAVILWMTGSVSVVESQQGASDLAQPEDGPGVIDVARTVFLTELQSQHDYIRWAALRAATALDSRWIAEVVLPLASSPDILEQVLALEVIARVHPELGLAEFLAALQSGDRAVRLRGLQGLERLGDPQTALDVARVLETEGDPDLRAAAARALGSIGDPAAVPALYSAVDDDHAAVRRQAVDALIAVGDTNIGSYLVSRLGRARADDLIPLLMLLTRVRDPALVPEILPYLDHPHDPVRIWAATAILASEDPTTESSL
jgi:HEAT repeat protein